MTSSDKLFKEFAILFEKIKRKTDFHINGVIFENETPTYALKITVTPEIKDRGRL